MQTETRICKQCGKTLNLSVGRIDRQFCDELCKNKFHNTQAYEEEKEIKRIQLILKKNRKILRKMAARKDSDQISRERLLKEGFEFDYHTHFKNSKFKGYQYIFCFDYGYRPTKDKEYFKVVKAFQYKEE